MSKFFVTKDMQQIALGIEINPRSGELIKIPAAWFPKFRAGQNFKDRLK